MGIYVPWLADAARTTGYRVVEIAGWRTRGHGGMRVVEGVVGHHTGTPRTAPGDYPSLNVVTNGRAGLAGPLANEGLGRDGTIYIIAAGLCYHAGASQWAGFIDLNDEFLGIEAESDGSGYWTPQQLDCYPKLVAANLRYMSRGVDRYAAHRDVAVPAGRKPDPTGIDSGWMRTTARTYLNSGIPPLEEAVSAEDVKSALNDPNWRAIQGPDGQARTIVEHDTQMGVWMSQAHGMLRALSQDLDDNQVELLGAMHSGNQEILLAVAGITPGAPTDEQMDRLLAAMKSTLGAATAEEFGRRLAGQGGAQ